MNDLKKVYRASDQSSQCLGYGMDEQGIRIQFRVGAKVQWGVLERT